MAVARVKAVDKLEMERRVGLGEEIRHLKMGFDVSPGGVALRGMADAGAGEK